MKVHLPSYVADPAPEAMDERPSKTEKKKASLEVTKFTQALAKLTVKQMNDLKLPSEIHEELMKVHRIKTHAAKNRHIKYVSSLLRTSGQYLEIKEAATAKMRHY